MMNTLIRNIRAVDTTLYRSGEIMPDGVPDLLNLGIRTVICLKDTDKQEEVEIERDAVEARGITHLWHPMANRGVFSYDDIDKVDDILAQIDLARTPVLVHCHKGNDRSSVVVACYRIKVYQWEVGDAIEEGKRCGWAWYNRGQREAVKGWAETLQREEGVK